MINDYCCCRHVSAEGDQPLEEWLTEEYPDEQEFLVKAILDEKTIRSHPRYIVKYEVRHMLKSEVQTKYLCTSVIPCCVCTNYPTSYLL
jgi:hypothetical protein